MASTTGNTAAVADQAQDALKEGAEKAKEQAANVKDQAQGAAQQAQERAREQVDQRTTDAGEAIKGHAGDARSMAEQRASVPEELKRLLGGAPTAAQPNGGLGDGMAAPAPPGAPPAPVPPAYTAGA